MGYQLLQRRGGWNFHYSLTYLDSANVAILETDRGFPSPAAKREPTRRLCVANVAHIEELQDWCDEWNTENAAAAEKWREENVVPYL